jgi:hypothetical protein
VAALRPHADSVRDCVASGVGDIMRIFLHRVFSTFALVMLCALLAACGPSLEQIAQRVQASMQESPDVRKLGVSVTKVLVMKESGNKYQGLATVEYKGLERQVPVQVTADGENVMWRTEPGAFMFVIQHEFQRTFGMPQ